MSGIVRGTTAKSIAELEGMRKCLPEAMKQLNGTVSSLEQACRSTGVSPNLWQGELQRLQRSLGEAEESLEEAMKQLPANLSALAAKADSAFGR